MITISGCDMVENFIISFSNKMELVVGTEKKKCFSYNYWVKPVRYNLWKMSITSFNARFVYCDIKLE